MKRSETEKTDIQRENKISEESEKKRRINARDRGRW